MPYGHGNNYPATRRKNNKHTMVSAKVTNKIGGMVKFREFTTSVDSK